MMKRSTDTPSRQFKITVSTGTSAPVTGSPRSTGQAGPGAGRAFSAPFCTATCSRRARPVLARLDPARARPRCLRITKRMLSAGASYRGASSIAGLADSVAASAFRASQRRRLFIDRYRSDGSVVSWRGWIPNHPAMQKVDCELTVALIAFVISPSPDDQGTPRSEMPNQGIWAHVSSIAAAVATECCPLRSDTPLRSCASEAGRVCVCPHPTLNPIAHSHSHPIPATHLCRRAPRGRAGGGGADSAAGRPVGAARTGASAVRASPHRRQSAGAVSEPCMRPAGAGRSANQLARSPDCRACRARGDSADRRSIARPILESFISPSGRRRYFYILVKSGCGH